MRCAGGGTTLVEASALGRRAIGIDINSLAIFVSRVKTTLFSTKELAQVQAWGETLVGSLNPRNQSPRPTEWISLGYQRNINCRTSWPIRKIIELALSQLRFPEEKLNDFARCVLLKTSQWALDCRQEIPTARSFREKFSEYMQEMIKGAIEYSNTVRAVERFYKPGSFRVLCLCRSAAGIETDDKVSDKPAPSLILTSPPYPGVHVLYHRWQVQGRKEASAPYWITNNLDGNGESFYTFGSRKEQSQSAYYAQALATFSSIAQIANRKTLIVQLVAFSQPDWQLQKYLDVMGKAGLREISMSTVEGLSDKRIWRRIPNRKWYAQQRGQIACSNEVLLFHRLK